MSLLLDALKKAAEQKARKSKSSEADADGNADETLLDVAADVGARAQPEDGSDDSSREDETELDHSELSARLERSSVVRGRADDTRLDVGETTDARVEAERPPAQQEDDTGLDIPDATQPGYQRGPVADDKRDDTGLDIPETTETRLRTDSPEGGFSEETAIDVPVGAEQSDDEPVPGQRLQTGDDEAMVFTSGDETDLSQVGGEELTGIGAPADSERDDVDETDLSQVGGEELKGIGDRSVYEEMRNERQQAEAARDSELWEKDDTGLDVAADDDETVLGEPFDEVTARGDSAPAGDEDQTDYRHPARSADEVKPADVKVQGRREGGAGDEDETLEPGRSVDDVQDEDLSLLLIEPDPTNPPDTGTAHTDPGQAAERQRVLDAADELSLEDTTRNRAASEQTDTETPTITNPSQTTRYSDDTRVAHGDSDTISNLPPGEATATHTYAPDNYDRTLMKLPSDDESKLFAGMKSDSDVIMTPDYAKKVFRSKTSAQRLQHYKVYLGIAIVIVLAIGIFGGFQYQEESVAIDNFLMPLKRDPMPGLIQPQVEEDTSLFAASDSDATARTIEIIQAAEVGDDAPAAVGEALEPADSGVIAMADGDDAAMAADAEPAPAAAASAQAEAQPAQTVSAGATQARQAEREETVVAEAPGNEQPAGAAQPDPEISAGGSGEIAMLSISAPEQAATEADPEPTSNLQILSSNEYRQNDLLLRDAYQAYLAGNDAQALRLYNQVLEVDPTNRNALLARAAINVQNGDVDAAVRDYQALLLLNPKDSLAMSSLLAVAEYSPQEAETQLKLMLRDEPQSPYLNFALANAYGAQNRWLEAQRHYFTALQNNPQDPNYAYNLAVSLEHISQPASAANYYRRALENIDNGLATFSPEVVSQRLAVLGKP